MKIPKIKEGINSFDVRVRFRNNFGYFGPGSAKLLEYIDENNSVREACEKMGMSYSKAWKILKNIKEDTGYDAVICQQGGKKGGKALLSEQGKALLDSYRAFEKEVKDFAKKRFEEYLEENTNDE